MEFEASDPNFEERVRDSFSRQRLMLTLGAELTEVAVGRTVIKMPFAEEFTQQNGFIHAGVVSAIADSACGYAAMTLMPAEMDVLSVEFKVNLIAPAVGEKLIAQAEVLKSGRTLTICRGEVFAVTSGNEKLVSAIQATMIARPIV